MKTVQDRDVPTQCPPVLETYTPFRLSDAFRAAEGELKAFLERWSFALLRISLGLVFAAFGFLKFFPGASPAEPVVTATWAALSFGLIHGQVAMIATAIIEVLAGVLLLSGRGARLALPVLALVFVGIFSPLVLLPDWNFTPDGPTLLGQYIFKNVVLAAASLVIAAEVLRRPRRHRGRGRAARAQSPR